MGCSERADAAQWMASREVSTPLLSVTAAVVMGSRFVGFSARFDGIDAGVAFWRLGFGIGHDLDGGYLPDIVRMEICLGLAGAAFSISAGGPLTWHLLCSALALAWCVAGGPLIWPCFCVSCFALVFRAWSMGMHLRLIILLTALLHVPFITKLPTGPESLLVNLRKGRSSGIGRVVRGL